MTKKKKLLQRMIALVLVAALWWQTDSMRFFVTVFAAEKENVVSENTNLSSDSELSENDSTDADVPVTILGEVETLRTEGEKHFRMSDGSFMAVSYGMPVHYQDEDGEWQDIDNRMVLSEDQATYQTYNLQSTTNFSSSLTEGILFETSYDDTSVMMSLLDTIEADNLMKGEAEIEIETEPKIEVEIETEPESEFEKETEMKFEENLIEAKQDIEELEQTIVETEEITTEQEQNTEVLEENIEETVNLDLLVFDRAAVADTTVEVQDVLGSVSNVSQNDEKDEGWTMEDILPENIQDSLLYEDVFPGVDLLYTKYSHNVKEQIIVNSVQETYRYDFMLTLDGVEAVLNEDGSVSLVQKENLENEIYYIPAPFMQDADGIVSYDVEYMLTDVSEGVILTVVADAEWMNEDRRAFPVAIDPTIIIRAEEESKELYISYTAQGAPDSKNTGLETYVGYTTYHSLKEYRSFIHFTKMPEIPAGMTVVDGQFHACLKTYTEIGCDELDLGIYEVTSSKPSTASSYRNWIYNLTWNTMPTYDTSNMIDYTTVSESTIYQYHSWDLTELFKKWYVEDTENRTVAWTMVPGSYSNTHCGEASFFGWEDIAPPVIVVAYRNTVGIEPYYTYQTMGVGDAGTAYIADATGQFKVVNPIITFVSTVNPFGLSLVYNSDYFADDADLDYQPPTKMGTGNIAMKLGQGWTLDIIQTMHTETIGDTMYLCYTDGDGTKHYFVKDDEKNSADDSNKTFYYDEDGLGLKTEITNTQKTNFIMYDDSGNSWTFINGRLDKKSDENGNYYSITYNSNNKISSVGQVNGNIGGPPVATFTYSGDYVSTITDAAGNVYSFSYTNGKLTGISRNGEQTATYSYGPYANTVTSIIDSKSGYTISLGYRYSKVAGVQENVNGIFGANFGISYPNYSKTVYTSTSDEGTLYTSYLFDYAQRTINAYVTDKDNNILGASNAVYTDTQAETTEDSVSKKTNRTEKIGGVGISNPSLLTGGGCEGAGWAFPGNSMEYVAAYYDTSVKRTGLYSMRIVPENTTGTVYAIAYCYNINSLGTYTLSAYIKTSECSSLTGEGIVLKVTDLAGNTFTGKGLDYVTSEQIDDGWTRIQLTFQAATTGRHTISIYAEGVNGIFYVDDVQLGKGETAGTLDLLKYGSYESGISQWSGNYITSSVDKGWNKSQCLVLTGHPDNNAYAYQTVNINLPATETFVLSGWAKGNSVPDNVTTHSDKNQDKQKQFGLRAKIIYTDNTSEYHYVPFNPDVNEWQFTSLSIVPKSPTKTISTIQVICTFAGNANEAYFDNISLYREVAQTMRYDDDGNLQSVNTPGLSEETNTYEGGNLIHSVTGGNGTYTYTYDDTYKHRLTNVRDGVITQSFSYDRFGNTVGTVLKSYNNSNPLSITSSATYSDDGNRVTSLTDSAGNSVEYEYGNNSSKMYALPTTTTDGRGNSTTTAYDSYGRTIEVEVPELVSISYAYEQGLLTSIEREDIEGESTQEYRFTYDDFGRTTAVYIGNRLLASYAYRNTGEMISMTYANGTTVEYVYDILGRVIKETFKSGNTEKRTVEYTYDNNGQINSIKDSVSGTENYVYDRLGRVVYYENEETDVRCSYTYDENSRLIYTGYDAEDLSGGSERYSYNSNKTDGISDGLLTSMQMITSYGLGREYDYLQRLTERRISGLTENYTYKAGKEANTTTTQVSGMTNTLGETVVSDYQYTYDANGNIRVVIDNADGGEGIAYTYDKLNQLTGVSYRSGGIERYTYDAHGNLLTFNNGISSHTYTYGNSEWKDLLTAVDGVPFFYDELGNPLSYYNGQSYSLSWTEGRKLATITTGGKTTNYLYDASGNRIKKTNSDGSYILYVIANGTAIGEKHYSAEDELVKTLRYIYDENGSVCGYVENSADGAGTYCFIKNLQGDVTHVYRVSDKAIVATYTYNSWGNIISATGEKAEENPFRYRGYYYDAETGFYYVSSRYYDPEIGRWINADIPETLTADFENFAQYNLFAYCFNNPVNLSDETGTWPSWATKLAIGVGAIVVGAAVVAATAATGGAAAAFVGAAVAGLKAAAVSGAIGAAVGAGTSAVSHRVSTGSWNGAGKVAIDGAVDGFASGFMTGGIMAGGSQILSSGFKVAANAGVPTGRNGGLTIGNKVRVLSPNHPQAYEAGGTLLKIGSKYKNIRFDVGSNSLFHMNIQLAKTANYHLPIGILGSGLCGGIARD
ncbi:MAG: hypothetical protein J6J73_02510 [Agathobacter sp.]|nr:hypothetical protein [Agathobacter sp.]